MIDYIIDWNDKNIEFSDIEGFEFKIDTEEIQIEIFNTNILEPQDSEIIESYDFEFWVNECHDNAKATLIELFEKKPELKEKLKPL